jgi:hypothetical protein
MTTLRQAIADAAAFLAPSVDTASGQSLVRRLSDNIPATWPSPQESGSPPFRVVSYCLVLLQAIHQTAKDADSQLGVKDWRQANALIDIIIILGLYRVLPEGVGPPESQRRKSILLEHEGQHVRYPENERRPLEENITTTLLNTVNEGGEIGESLLRKNFVDILSGILDLAFNPEYPDSDRLPWHSQYEQTLSKYCFLRNPLT